MIGAENVLEVANRLTSQDRNKSYGHPLENFTDTAALFTGILHAAGKLDRTQRITADEAMVLMIAVKLARLARTPDHQDSQIDIAGYARTLEMAQEKRAEAYCKG